MLVSQSFWTSITDTDKMQLLEGYIAVPRKKGADTVEPDFSFQKFSQNSFYKRVNLDLLEQSGIRPGQKVVEIACGTGGVTRLILEKLRGARESLVIGQSG